MIEQQIVQRGFFRPVFADAAFDEVSFSEQDFVALFVFLVVVFLLVAVAFIVFDDLGNFGGVVEDDLVAADLDKDGVLAQAKSEAKIASEIAGKKLVKEIYVPGKILNFVQK